MCTFDGSPHTHPTAPKAPLQAGQPRLFEAREQAAAEEMYKYISSCCEHNLGSPMAYGPDVQHLGFS